ncbi:hypothetical protein ABT026_25985 [Streptomyces sp. NPDC002734]|uniref:hypothetical protein n=1 Tax=Streptomyces sp. NPDC002734 TaxID=3154426 RepID=UPI0033244FB2
MTVSRYRYRYVGPEELRALARPGRRGRALRGPEDLREAEAGEVFTYVVDLDGVMRPAPRRSEHVVCAGGEPVLGAGEISFRPAGTGSWAVAEVGNLSTGYCPDLASWSAVATALDRAGIRRPDGFTEPVVFRWCPGCGQAQVVRDAHFVCVFCDADLPPEWNGGLTGPQ